MGDDEAAVAFLAIAARHAAETPDPLLVGTVATVSSGLAYFAGDYTKAGYAAACARGDDCHPYTLPILAIGEAHAAARLRQPERARAALAEMEANVWSGPSLPGPAAFGEEAAHAHLAAVLCSLDEGEAAERHARCSLDLLAGTGKVYLAGGTNIVLARSFLRRDHPDPEQAAAAATAALEAGPDRAVVDSAARTWRGLAGRWGALPAVRELGEMVRGAQRALPPGSGSPTAP